jgi:hypothetical protein
VAAARSIRNVTGLNFDFFTEMAKLRDQKWIVKELNDFFKNTNYTHPDTWKERVKNIADDAVPEKDFSGYLATKMTIGDRITSFFRPSYFSSEQRILHRASENNRLYKSCRDDGFIEDVYKEFHKKGFFDMPDQTTRNKMGIRVTNKGSDLIHWIGFWSIALEKYKPVTLIATGAFGVTILSGLGWFIANVVIPMVRNRS